MKCMIVDDEKMAIKVIESHISHIKGLEVLSVHYNAMDAFSALQQQPVDVLFLDIQMPKMSGLSLLRSLPSKPHVILTTAHREFALESYELEVIDYLLKPISLERFTKAMGKIFRLEQKQFHIQPVTSPTPATMEAPFIYIKSDRQFVKILLDDILYIESIRNHILIVTEGKKYTTLLSLSQIEEKLPPQRFLRIHRSYIISCTKIDQFSHSNITIGSQLLPIGNLYKNEVLKRLSLNLI